jgi:hypothetical protein
MMLWLCGQKQIALRNESVGEDLADFLAACENKLRLR